MRNYDDKLKELKDRMLSKISIYKNGCIMRIRISNSHDNIDKYIMEYHYLILLEQYLQKKDAFNEMILGNNRRLTDKTLDKLLASDDPIFSYIMYMNNRYKSIDMINLFNNEIGF